MWSTLSISHGDDYILKRLKQQLAGLACKCKICEKYNVTSIHGEMCAKKSKEPSRLVEETAKSGQVPCPGCYVAYNLLKRTDRTFKDEETIANTVEFSLDKSMQKTVLGLDRTTSMTKKSVKYSNSVIMDILNENNLFEDNHEPDEEQNPARGYGNVNCLCLENFIDSIRPPLKYSPY